jgi:uncharacterized protein
MKRLVLLLLLTILGVVVFYFFHKNSLQTLSISLPKPSSASINTNPLSIDYMRQQAYPGSQIKIEKTLPDGSNYHQYLTSYQSQDLKIYALLTVPMGDKPANGWPVILFNHGYIAPKTYQTFPSSGQYATYYPIFSKSGYIVFKPDYRANGQSEGQPEGAYYSPAYAVDDLNALSSIKNYPDSNPNKIGIWGHSMGGNITLRDLVVNTKDIKVAVIWGGVVGSYDDLMNNWQRKVPFRPSPSELALRNRSRSNLTNQYGTPTSNPTFWNSIDPTKFIQDIKVPIQLDAGGSDEEVPVAFSETLYNNLKAQGKTVEFYSYPGDNHNISNHFNEAMQNSLTFFNKYLK